MTCPACLPAKANDSNAEALGKVGSECGEEICISSLLFKPPPASPAPERFSSPGAGRGKEGFLETAESLKTTRWGSRSLASEVAKFRVEDLHFRDAPLCFEPHLSL